MILDAFIQPKRFFNANSKEDLRIAKEFFQSWSWGADTCPFVLEQPYVSIPEMMRDRVLSKLLKMSEN
jgi:hypothetical protein